MRDSVLSSALLRSKYAQAEHGHPSSHSNAACESIQQSVASNLSAYRSRHTVRSARIEWMNGAVAPGPSRGASRAGGEKALERSGRDLRAPSGEAQASFAQRREERARRETDRQQRRRQHCQRFDHPPSCFPLRLEGQIEYMAWPLPLQFVLFRSPLRLCAFFLTLCDCERHQCATARRLSRAPCPHNYARWRLLSPPLARCLPAFGSRVHKELADTVGRNEGNTMNTTTPFDFTTWPSLR